MARGKNAAALFEVIHSGRQPVKPLMSTPKWWFKRSRDGGGAHMAAIAAASNAMHATARTPFDHTDHSDHTDPTDHTESGDPTESESSVATLAPPAAAAAIVAPPTTSHAVCGVRMSESASETIAHRRYEEDEHDDSVTAGSSSIAPSVIHEIKPKAKAPGYDVAMDAERKLITLRLSYSNAIVAAFAVLVALGLAFVVGRALSHGPALTVARDTSEQLRGKPAHPEVLNVTPPMVSASTPTHVSKAPESPSSQVREPDAGLSSANGDPTAKPDANKAGASAAASDASDRQVGLNYVVIQSYPDEKSANDVRDSLQNAGVPCTVEKGLRFAPGWFSVVGLQGFGRITAPECRAYCNKLDDISKQLAGTKRSFKAFQPMAYKWDKPKAG